MLQTEKLTIEQFVQQGLSERAYIAIAGEITHAYTLYQFTFRPSAEVQPSAKDCSFSIFCRDLSRRTSSENNFYVLGEMENLFGKTININHDKSGEIRDLHHYTKETIALKTAQIFDKFNKPQEHRILRVDYR